LQKDVDTANDYLNQFARLMRMILDRSEYAYTEIAEEIELLTLYLQAESMRIGKKMTFSFDIAPDLDPDETLLPTMILQPFVENAIWHGISPKEGPGHITIRFLSYNDHLCCEVEDNGVGRSSRPKSSFKSHQSKSISITKRRLEMLSKEHDTESELKIIDLFSEDQQPTGTKVQLFLPILE
jgi:sensor histidine kinase YesM